MSFMRDALLVATKDLRIERRSRIALQQIIPFGGVVVLLFAFALDSDRTLLHQAAPGLFWAAVLLALLLAVGRSFALEEANRARDALRLSGLDGAPGDAWPWVQLLAAFAVLAVAAGTVAFGPLLEEA